MSSSCPYQQTILKSFQRGFPGDDERDHLMSCDDCREAVALAESLRAWDAAAPEPRLPHPELVWRKAQVVARLKVEHRRQRFLMAIQVAGMALGLFLTWAAAELLFPGVTREIPAFATDAFQTLAKVPPIIIWTVGLGAATILVTQLLDRRWDSRSSAVSRR